VVVVVAAVVATKRPPPETPREIRSGIPATGCRFFISFRRFDDGDRVFLDQLGDGSQLSGFRE
jgi:hypothetical protein